MKTSNKSSKKSPDKSTDQLIAKLTAAYQSRDSDTKPACSMWQQNVMRSVRQIGPYGENNKDRIRSGQLAWRLAPAALVLMIIMAVMIISIDDTIEYQVASLAVSDPLLPYLMEEAF